MENPPSMPRPNGALVSTFVLGSHCSVSGQRECSPVEYDPIWGHPLESTLVIQIGSLNPRSSSWVLVTPTSKPNTAPTVSLLVVLTPGDIPGVEKTMARMVGRLHVV